MASSLWIIPFLAIVSQQFVLGCSPMDHEMTLNETIEQASVVMLGEVVKHYANTNIIGNVYTAEMKIYCVLKAPENLVINAVHNVSEAGVVDGRCHSVNLTVGGRYIVLGYVSAGEIKPFDDAIGATPESINSISKLCGLYPRLPTGIAESDSHMCPSGDDKGCLIPPMGNDAGHDHDDHDHHGDDHDHDDHDHHGDDHDHDANDHDHNNDGVHTHDDHHDGHDHDDLDHDHDDHHDEHDEHAHDDHDHEDHGHDGHDDDHHSDDHEHHHDDHHHDDNEHDHNSDGVHDHDDHHHGHVDHDIDDHDHEDHHGEHDHEHDVDHVHAAVVGSSASVIGQAFSVIMLFAVMHML